MPTFPSETGNDRRSEEHSMAGRLGLLVVDMTLGFTDPTSSLGCEAGEAIDAITELLGKARDSAVPVAYTRVAFNETITPGGRQFQRKVPALKELVDGLPSTSIDPRISPIDGELVLRKECPSAFWETALFAWTQEHGIGSLMVTGATTSGCVRATVVDSLQHGLRTIVPAEAVVDRDAVSHRQALTDISWRYAEVASTHMALQMLSETEMHRINLGRHGLSDGREEKE